MALPILSDEATSKDVAESLLQVARETVELRNKRSAGELSDSDRADLTERMSFINDMDPIQRALSAAEEIVTRASQAEEMGESRGPSAAFDDVSRVRDGRSVGQRVTDTDEYRAMVAAREAGSTYRSFDVEGRLPNLRTTLTTSYSDTSQAGDWLPVGQPIAPIPRQQRLFVRDLMSQIGTTLNAVPYILEQGPTSTEVGATAVVQGVAKPEVEMDFLLQTAVVTKIAAWIPATTEIIEDAPALRGYIDGRLSYMLALREEQQLLFGKGIGADLHGVLKWNSGPIQNQTQNAVTADVPATIAQAIAKIENVDLEADGCVLNPLDFWQSVSTRFSTHPDNSYGGNAPAVLSGTTWGLPAIRSRSFTTGQAAVGAFRMGATIADRESTNIRVGNQHASFFTQNLVAILAESRLALLTHRPDAFVNATIAFS